MKKINFHTEWTQFKHYIKSNELPLLIFNALLLLVWLPWITQVFPRVDSEVLINNPYSPGNWLEIGRQGGILTRYLFNTRWFNPLFTSLFGFGMICIAGILFGYLFYRCSNIHSALYAAFGLICFTCPILAETFYFDMMVFDIAWAFVLCAAAVGLSYIGILRKSLLCCIAAVLAMIWIFSTYQIFVLLYVVAAVVCFVLLYCRCTFNDSATEIPYIRIVIGLILLTILAYGINTVITNAFFMTSNYLDSQIYWKTFSVQQCLQQIKKHIVQGVTGEGTFYTPLYGIMACVVVLLSCWKVFSQKARMGWLFVLAIVGIQFAPFLLTVYLGGMSNIRAQLVYPMVLACDLLILYVLIADLKLLRCGVLALAAILCWTQVQTTQRLVYTDQVRAQEDLTLASAVQQRIYEAAGVNKPLAFVGVYQNRLNLSCLRGQLIGCSIFNFNSEELPHYTGSSWRICGIASAAGFDFVRATDEQIYQGRILAQDMPCWPQDGSVVDAGDYVVIKLSEDLWPRELNILVSPQEVTDNTTVHIDAEEKVYRQIDEQLIQEGYLVINGWVFKEDANSRNVTPGVFLYNTEENKFWMMNTDQTHRKDVADFYDNSLYEYSGYTSIVSLDTVPGSFDNYELYIGVQEDGIWHLSFWGKLNIEHH